MIAGFFSDYTRIVGTRTYGLVMESGQAVTSVKRGLALLAEGIEELLAATAAPMQTPELLAVLRGVEVARRKVSAVDHQVLTQCAEQGVAVQLGHRKLDVCLHQLLRISRRDARARIRAAVVCGPRRSFTGEPLAPIQPCTAAAAHDGLIGVEHTKIIGQILGKIPATIPAETVAQVEESLAGYASTLSPEALTMVGYRMLAYLNPDGNLTDTADRARRRSLSLGRQGVDLMSGISGTLTPSCRTKLDALFAKLAAPGAGTDHEHDPHPEVGDPRSQVQRNHDALEALCDRVLGDPGLGTHRGVPVTAIITVRLQDLEICAGQATTASGGVLPIRDALAMAERCHPILVVFDHNGRPLHLGRRRRLASADQRLALIAADGGCTSPGCIIPADQCQIHHVRPHAHGGRTDMDNLTLVCDSDHTGVHPGRLGWTTTIGGDPRYPGRCAWTPPAHLRQRPRINHYHHPDELLHGDRGNTDEPP